jgi:hypothetical protein
MACAADAKAMMKATAISLWALPLRTDCAVHFGPTLIDILSVTMALTNERQR